MFTHVAQQQRILSDTLVFYSKSKISTQIFKNVFEDEWQRGAICANVASWWSSLAQISPLPLGQTGSSA